MLTKAQLRGARAMLDWSMAKLAAQAGVSISSIKRCERELPRSISAELLGRLQDALTSAGIAFLPDDGHGVGIRLNGP